MPALLSLWLTLGLLASAKPDGKGWDTPEQAQVIDQKSFNVIESVTPQDKFDGGSVSATSSGDRELQIY